MLVITAVLLLLSLRSYGRTDTYPYTITGPFTSGTSFLNQDPNYAASVVTYKSVLNTVALKLADNVLISGSFTYTVTLNIVYYTYASPLTAVTVSPAPTLTVSYTPGQGIGYKGLDIFQLPAGTNAYKMQVTVTSSASTGITPPAGSVTLTSEITVDRIYTFNTSQAISPTYALAANSAQVNVTWNPAALQTADEYDVEWTTINDGNPNYTVISTNAGATYSTSPSTLNTAWAQVFVHNASRITTTGGTFSIALISTDSYLLVRVRQAQYNANGVRIAGNWDSSNGTKYAIFALTWDEQAQNWQYSAAFAEGGKKKEVISYFDGTLRGRQTVTLNNTDNVAIAQENIYDYNGRPTASILPAPYKEPSVTPYLHYIANFNVSAPNVPYTAANVIGTTPATCELNPDPLNTFSGASHYYSNASHTDFPGLSSYNNYIPDAGTYPLSVTQYTADNTGRIRSQGGVGPAFQPGKNGSPLLSKTTKYYYGKPEQWELDQLFANDAGYAEHYLKNLVIDPNGQASISYLNASGKTVATALTGSNPSTLDPLPSFQPVTPSTPYQRIHILKPEQFVYNVTDEAINASTTHLSTVVGTDTLQFSMQELIDYYPNPSYTLCSNCYYLMTTTVTDDCGTVVASTSSPVSIGSGTANCSGAGTYNNPPIIVPIGHPGEYNISIKMAYDASVIESYAETFISQGPAKGYLQSQFDYIKQHYLDTINVSGCYKDCHTCETLLASQTGFVTAISNKCLALGLDPAGVSGSGFTTWVNGLYSTLKAQCDASQSTCTYNDPCASVEAVMETDVSPGGQYALFDSNGNAVQNTINVIYNNWRTVFPAYPSSNAIYKANQFVLPDSTITSPNDTSFTLQEMVQYWQPSWAISFLQFHPEYCKLEQCEHDSVSEKWDMLVQNDYTTAGLIGKIPGVPAGTIYSHTLSSDWLLQADPFFASGGVGASYYSQMQGDLLNYSTNILKVPVTGAKSLMQFVDYAVYCQSGNINTGGSPDAWSSCIPNSSCRVTDREWAAYSNYYFNAKQKYYDLLTAAACGASCQVGQPVVIALPGALPAPSDFSITAGTGSCGTGLQQVVVSSIPGSVNQQLTVTLYYPNVTTFPSVTFNAGTSQQTVCIPSSAPLNTVGVNAVYAGSSAPTFGNDPSYIVTVTDVAGGTVTNDCGNMPFNINTTYISLTDSHGNPVTATNPVTAVIKYVTTPCPGQIAGTLSIPLTIAAGQSTSHIGNQGAYPSTVGCNVSCHWGYNTASISCVQSLTNASNIMGLPICSTGYTNSNPQPPTPAGCDAAYAVKTPRFPGTTSTLVQQAQLLAPGDTALVTGPQRAAAIQQAQDNCSANVQNWMTPLQPGLTAIGATPTQINNLSAAFLSICQAGANLTHPEGASTLGPGTTGPYASFGAAIKTILLGGGNFTSQLN
jgi:hypothetical protein